jgi:hypothetical protein
MEALSAYHYSPSLTWAQQQGRAGQGRGKVKGKEVGEVPQLPGIVQSGDGVCSWEFHDIPSCILPQHSEWMTITSIPQ